MRPRSGSSLDLITLESAKYNDLRYNLNKLQYIVETLINNGLVHLLNAKSNS